ncbi:MAG: hypothetical protein RLY61_424 [Candidatus Parcubacteria bacterium]|jgi:hypothetical protein
MYTTNTLTLTSTQGLKASIIKYALVTGSMFGIYYLLVGRYYPEGIKITAVTTGLVILAYTLLKVSLSLRNDRLLLQTTFFKQNNITYIDGAKVALYGKIRAKDTPIVSPITQTPCVFYKYGMYHWILRKTGKGSRKDKEYFYSGHCLAPTSLDIGYKHINILSVPLIKNFPELICKFDTTTYAYFANATEYIKANQLTKLDTHSITHIRHALTSAKETMLDQDGSNRSDTSFKDYNPPIEQLELEEVLIKEGDDVCVIGVWNSAKNGLIADYGIASLTLFKGLPQTIIQTFSKQITGLYFLSFTLIVAAHCYIGYYAIELYKLEEPLSNLLHTMLNSFVP